MCDVLLCQERLRGFREVTQCPPCPQAGYKKVHVPVKYSVSVKNGHLAAPKGAVIWVMGSCLSARQGALCCRQPLTLSACVPGWDSHSKACSYPCGRILILFWLWCNLRSCFTSQHLLQQCWCLGAATLSLAVRVGAA